MTLLVTIAFIMAVAGCFIMLELSPFAFLEGLSGYLRPKNHSMKNRIKESKKKKEPKGLKLLFEEIKEILRLTGKSEQFIMLCVLAMILFVLGVMIALTMNNVLMVPVLAVGNSSFPFRNRFVTHIQFFCQLLLRQSKSFSFFCNIFSDFD